MASLLERVIHAEVLDWSPSGFTRTNSLGKQAFPAAFGGGGEQDRRCGLVERALRVGVKSRRSMNRVSLHTPIRMPHSPVPRCRINLQRAVWSATGRNCEAEGTNYRSRRDAVDHGRPDVRHLRCARAAAFEPDHQRFEQPGLCRARRRRHSWSPDLRA